MAKTKRKKINSKETDQAYFLKLVLYLIFGSLWLRLDNMPSWQIPIPVGLLFGVILASHDHFQIDRKIEYALLLVSSFIAFWLPIGLLIEV